MQSYVHPVTLEKVDRFFTASTEFDLRQKLDSAEHEMADKGFTLVKEVKIGRNAECPCGSGAKFKKCCIAKAA